MSIISKLVEKLPCGSGINYDWRIVTENKNSIVLTNAYDYMNEAGYYCGMISFTVTYKKKNNTLLLEKIKLEKAYTLRQYFPNLFSCIANNYREYGQKLLTLKSSLAYSYVKSELWDIEQYFWELFPYTVSY